MTLREKQTKWIKKIKKEHTCFAKMLKPLSSLKGQESYAYKIQNFMRFALDKKHVKHNEDFESLLKYDAEKITDILEDYVNHLENQNMLSGSINSMLTPIELFFEMNRKKDIITVDIQRPLHAKIVKKSQEKNISIRKFVNEILNKEIENDIFLKRILPALSLIQITENDILLRDESSKTVKIIQITLQNDMYWCDKDHSNNCQHIRYVMILPECVKFKDRINNI